MTKNQWNRLSAISPEPDRFVALDVFADSGGKLLAAWQIEVVCDVNQSTLVGVESGEVPFNLKAPHHDPRALQGGRIVIAAFTTDKNPPSGRIRVARLHFLETGAADYASKLITAASPGGGRIDLKIELVPSGEDQ